MEPRVNAQQIIRHKAASAAISPRPRTVSRIHKVTAGSTGSGSTAISSACARNRRSLTIYRRWQKPHQAERRPLATASGLLIHATPQPDSGTKSRRSSPVHRKTTVPTIMLFAPAPSATAGVPPGNAVQPNQNERIDADAPAAWRQGDPTLPPTPIVQPVAGSTCTHP